MLGGCPAPRDITNNSIQPLPTTTPTPIPWLSLDPVCTGSITRAEWLVCDNPQLNALHRRLAQQWATARQYASDEKYGVLEDQLYALLSERDQCQDVLCVATAYRRYLDGPPPVVRPTPNKPKPKPGKPPKHGHWKPRPGGPSGPGWPPPGRDGDGPSCVATAGSQEALRLARQCARVNPSNGWGCSPQRSCGSLKRNVVKGCNETYRKPEFCPKI
ncbi:hypothetical protein [Sphingomonas sp.]|uniref:hypothetical protein n=1 Tax=Sphingomonas sp. TaxID=28214 RepID=UPI001B02F3C0|nr:hypothetical protein [Sphingomonas sp.]MBO9713339.1 hypothetical protein [Sphingomonas sp.]